MTGEPRAWGWVQHLREGGTTPWAGWTEPGQPTGAALPGAQQLELVRRLNALAPDAGAPDPALVGRILTTSAPGRGQPDLELVGVATPSDFGPRPVDPADLHPRELLRVAAAVVAEDVVAAGLPPAPRPRRRSLWAGRRRRYRLVGNPELADPLREQLVAQGRPPGGRDPVVLVLAAPLDRLLVDAWTRRSFDRGAPAWGTWLRQVVRDDRVPSRFDTLAQARTWSRRVGRARVEVVVDPSRLGDVLGLRVPLELPGALAAAVPDLSRRVASLLTLHVPSEERTALLRRTLWPSLAGTEGPVLAVPAEHRDWMDTQAQRLTKGLQRAGYAVHGDLAALRPAGAASPEAVTSPDPTATLDLALRVLLRGRPIRGGVS